MVRSLAVVPVVLSAVAIGCLGAGVAHADGPGYEVSGTWVLETVNGQPAIRPAPQDDTLNVTCRDDDRMKEHRFSDKDLVADSFERVDGTGIMVMPRMTKPGQRLTITITCSG